MDWRQRIYKNYVSNHISFVCSKQVIQDLRNQFPVWRSYYGKFLPKDKEAVILDVARGNGGFVYWLKELGYKNATGIDISPEQIEEARSLKIKDVELADLRIFLKNKTAYYDCLIARDIIEHFDKEEVLDILDIFYKSLKPNSVLIIQTPNAESPFGSRYRYYDLTHGLSFTTSSLNQALKTAGFKEMTFYPMGPVVHGLKSLIRYILWKIIVLIIKFYLVVETGSSKGIFTQNLIAVAKK